MQQIINLIVDKYASINDLMPREQGLLHAAQQATNLAYVPYSDFHVGAAALLENGEIVVGSNQENATFAASICAERTLLTNVAINHSGMKIITIAISYRGSKVESNKPVSPCGICRQALLECETRQGAPLRLVMAGETGEVWIVEGVSTILPLAFSATDFN